MTGDQLPIHPDWLQPPPRPGMSASARVFVGLGIAGGLVTLTTCAALIMGLLQREPLADAPPIPPEVLAATRPAPDAPAQPVVLEPSTDRKAVAPEDPTATVLPEAPAPPVTRSPATSDERDRTEVVLFARLVQLDPALRDTVEKPADGREPTDGAALLKALAAAKPAGVAPTSPEAGPVDVVDALNKLEARGAAWELALTTIETHHGVPATTVQETRHPSAVDRRLTARPGSIKCNVFPQVLDRDRVHIDLFAEFTLPQGDEQKDTAPGTLSVTTGIDLRNGQVVPLGGLDDAKLGPLVLLLGAEVHPPRGPAAIVPLSKEDRDERSRRQCQFLQDELARRFPASQVTIKSSDGKLLVEGTAVDADQQKAILAAVDRRAQQWQMVDPAAPFGSAASPIVASLRWPEPMQVMLRMKLFALDRSTATRAARSMAGISPDDQALLEMLLRLNDPRHTTVLEGLSTEKLEAAMGRLAQRNLVRVLSEPTMITVDRRKATLTSGGEIRLAEDDALRAKPESDKSGAYTLGTTIEATPAVLKDGRIRVEVTPHLRQVIEDNRQSNPPRLVIASQAVTAVAVMRNGQTLAVAGLPDVAPPNPATSDPAQQFLLVTAEVVDPIQPPQPTATAAHPGPQKPAAPAKPDPNLVAARASEPVTPEPRYPVTRQVEYVAPVDRPAPPTVAAVPDRQYTPPAPAAKDAVALADLVGKGELSLPVQATRTIGVGSKILRASSVNPTICEVTQSADQQVVVTGKMAGQTHLRVWFAEPLRDPVSLRVRVTEGPQAVQMSPEKVRVLQEVVAELFPKCQIRLTLVGNKLTVDAIARDDDEARLILSVVRGAIVDTGSSPSSFQLIDRVRRIGVAPAGETASAPARPEPEGAGMAFAESTDTEEASHVVQTSANMPAAPERGRSATFEPIRPTPSTGGAPLPMGPATTLRQQPVQQPPVRAPQLPSADAPRLPSAASETVVPEVPEEKKSDRFGLSGLVDRLKEVKLPFEKRVSTDEQAAPAEE